jgi:hypothetical protein
MARTVYVRQAVNASGLTHGSRRRNGRRASSVTETVHRSATRGLAAMNQLVTIDSPAATVHRSATR